MAYYMTKTVNLPFDQAVEATIKALADQGFGILTDIDVQATLNEKLDSHFSKKYRILGACHPEKAYKALEAEDKIGVLLPCSVVVHETEDGTIEVAGMDPVGLMDPIQNRTLKLVADDVRVLLGAALDNL